MREARHTPSRSQDCERAPSSRRTSRSRRADSDATGSGAKAELGGSVCRSDCGRPGRCSAADSRPPHRRSTAGPTAAVGWISHPAGRRHRPRDVECPPYGTRLASRPEHPLRTLSSSLRCLRSLGSRGLVGFGRPRAIWLDGDAEPALPRFRIGPRHPLRRSRLLDPSARRLQRLHESRTVCWRQASGWLLMPVGGWCAPYSDVQHFALGHLGALIPVATLLVVATHLIVAFSRKSSM